MLKVFAAFLAIFWLLGLLVHLAGFVHVFGMGALALFAIDQMLTASAGTQVPRPRQHLNF